MLSNRVSEKKRRIHARYLKRIYKELTPLIDYAAQRTWTCKLINGFQKMDV